MQAASNGLTTPKDLEISINFCNPHQNTQSVSKDTNHQFALKIALRMQACAKDADCQSNSKEGMNCKF